MKRVIVGNIQGYDVVYSLEVDYVFCKNTALPLCVMKDALKNNLDRVEIPEKNLVILFNGNIVDMGCLSTTRENLRNIAKEINIFKNSYVKSNKLP